VRITRTWFTTERTCSEPALFPFPAHFVSQTPEPVTNFSSVICAKARQPNFLKPCVYFVHHQFQHSRILHFAHRVNLCVSKESRNTQWLLHYTAVKGPVFITEMESVYCAVRTGSLTKQTTVCPSILCPSYVICVLFLSAVTFSVSLSQFSANISNTLQNFVCGIMEQFRPSYTLLSCVM
jgi:hypothetical protein